MPVGRNGSQTSTIAVVLLSLVEDFELHHLLPSAERSGLAFGNEAIDIARRDGKKMQIEHIAGTIRDKGLQIGIGGRIVSLCIQRTENIAVGMLSESKRIGPSPSRRPAERKRRAQKRSRHLSAGVAEEGCRSVAIGIGQPVLDVEHRRHSVAIGGIESARRKHNVVDHIGIDDRSTLLLAVAHQQRTIDLDIIDIDKVFVERATAHRILRRHLVVRADIGQRLEQRFHASLRPHVIFHLLHPDARKSTGPRALVGHRDRTQLRRLASQDKIHHRASGRQNHNGVDHSIARQANAESDSTVGRQLQLVAAALVGDIAAHRIEADGSDSGILERRSLAIDNASPHASNTLCINHKRHQHQKQHNTTISMEHSNFHCTINEKHKSLL